MIKVYKGQKYRIIMTIENYVLKTNIGRELEVEITFSILRRIIKYKIRQDSPKKSGFFLGNRKNLGVIKDLGGKKVMTLVKDSPLFSYLYGDSPNEVKLGQELIDEHIIEITRK